MSTVGSKNGSRLISKSNSASNSIPSSRLISKPGSVKSDGSNKSKTENTGIPKNLNASFVSKHSKTSYNNQKEIIVPVISINADKTKNLSRQNSKKSVIAKPDGTKIEIISLSDSQMAEKFPIININPIPARRFEIRLIIWNAEDVPGTDVSGNINGYVKSWVEML